MLVTVINKVMKTCQIVTGTGKYTCPTKYINGKLFFRFKNQWHSVAEHLADHADEFVREGGKFLSRPFKG